MTAAPVEEPVAQAMLQRLPSIDRLLLLPDAQALVAAYGRTLVVRCARDLLSQLRGKVQTGGFVAAELETDNVGKALRARCEERLAPKIRPVLNLTGTVIHTNLGRSVLADVAIDRLVQTMSSPNNLEFDLKDGKRSDRDALVESLICEITGAEAATVVNNNAAAVMLTIAALARGREAIISRGELVEIGGAFRMPDVMVAAGATMVEVGTTNRTHAADYAAAINERTALVMKVHTSNYVVQGFTASVDERELATIAHAAGLPLATDLGSGSLIDLAAYGLPHEPMPQQALSAGCDVVTFSGDKLLGGPQAGLIIGKRDVITRIRKLPMKRALRMSKLPLVALEATLRLYLQPEHLARDLPSLRHLTRPQAQIQALTQTLAPLIADAVAPRYSVKAVALSSQIGSGSLPVDRLPSAGVAVTPSLPGTRGAGTALDELANAFRSLPLPVIGRIAQGSLVLDFRCLEQASVLSGQLKTLRCALGLCD